MVQGDQQHFVTGTDQRPADQCVALGAVHFGLHRIHQTVDRGVAGTAEADVALGAPVDLGPHQGLQRVLCVHRGHAPAQQVDRGVVEAHLGRRHDGPLGGQRRLDPELRVVACRTFVGALPGRMPCYICYQFSYLPMFAFILRRLIQAVFVMVTVAFIAFTLFQYVGDPVLFLLGQDATQDQIRALRTQLGLDRSFLVQFWHFLLNAAQGEFGLSLRQGAKVSKLIAERFPATLELALIAAGFALLVGVPMGVYAALRRGNFLSQLFMTFSLLGVSLPSFLIGILLILVFAVWLGWFPSFGRGDVVNLGWWSTGLLTAKGWQHIVLPAVTLAIFQLTLIMRLVRAEMLEVLRTDYIKFARARGLSERVVHFGHALRNTLVPVITITGLQLGSLIAFAIITEQVFQWPGMGLLFIQAVQFSDIPVMAAYLCLISLIFVVINLAVDLLYFAVDPRLRIDDAKGGHL